jgi:hypothetical protein
VVVFLEFGQAVAAEELSLSGVAAVGEWLFLAPDEGAALVRLSRRADGAYDGPVSYPLGELVTLPGGPGEEIDLEGLDIDDAYLWCVGSHSGVRQRVKKHADASEVVEDLARVDFPAGRRVLARIPLDPNGSACRRWDGDATHPARTAAILSTAAGSGLLNVLAGDRHLGRFLALPGKDNGLDIEGLAVSAGRVLIGLRGPVLRGWAVVIEVRPVPDPAIEGGLVLGPVDSAGADQYVLHFLDLDGLGIRDLDVDGDDLLVLAGPTMLLDGPSRILRLPGGAVVLPLAVHREALIPVGSDLPVATASPPAPPGVQAPQAGHDHAEAITVLEGTTEARGVLVVYDSPGTDRQNPTGVRADVVDL